MYIIGREVVRHFKGMSISKKPKEWRQKPQHGPDPTSLILPLWRSPAGKTCQYSKCVFIYSWSQEPQGCSYQAGFSQSLGRTTGAPAWRAVPHHTLSPLCVGPESGSERRQTGHGTHTASIRPGHPPPSIWPPAEECLTGIPGNTQQPLHSKTASALGWELALMFYSSKLLSPTPEISSPRYRSCSISSCFSTVLHAPISSEYLHIETDRQ